MFTESERDHLLNIKTNLWLDTHYPLEPIYNSFGRDNLLYYTHRSGELKSYYKRLMELIRDRSTDGDFLYRIAAVYSKPNLMERVFEIYQALLIPRQVYRQYDSGHSNLYVKVEWLRDLHTAPRFDAQYRSEYLRNQGHPGFALPPDEWKGAHFSSRLSEYTPHPDYDRQAIARSHYHLMLRSPKLSTIKGVALTLILKTLEPTSPLRVSAAGRPSGSLSGISSAGRPSGSLSGISPAGPSASSMSSGLESVSQLFSEGSFTSERLERLFTTMCFVGGVEVTDVAVQIADGFPIFNFHLDNLPYSTLPGGILGSVSSMDNEYLIKRSDVIEFRYGDCYPEARGYSSRSTIHFEKEMEAEAIMWWVINSSVSQFANFRNVDVVTPVSVNTFVINNLPELICGAGLTSEVEPDTDALRRYLSDRSSSGPTNLVTPKGEPIRRRIREWLNANPSVPRRIQSKAFPDRPEYCVDPGSLPEDLRVWFNPLKVWFTPDPYSATNTLTDTEIETIASLRENELTHLVDTDPSVRDLTLRERLFRLDMRANEWTDMTRLSIYHFNDRQDALYPFFSRRAEIDDDEWDEASNPAELLEEVPDRDNVRAKAEWAYYYATRGFRSTVGDSAINLLESYSGNRSKEEIKELFDLLPSLDVSLAGEIMRHPYPWRLDLPTSRYSSIGPAFESYIRTSRVASYSGDLEAEAIRYRFYKTMTVEQHRQASSLYNNDPETPMTAKQYVMLMTAGISKTSIVSPLDPITLDLSNPEIFEETVRRLGIVFPLGSGSDSDSSESRSAILSAKRVYLINGLHIYNRILTRDPDIDHTKGLHNSSPTDAEIINALGVYPIWKTTEELRTVYAALQQGAEAFFVPIVPKCVNERAPVSFEPIAELITENRFIIAYGSVSQSDANASSSVSSVGSVSAAGNPRGLLAAGISRGNPGGLPAAGISRGNPGYLCYTLSDLAAGFRPGGIHDDILRYAVFDSNGHRKEVPKGHVDNLVYLVTSILNLLGEEDRSDASELLHNIANLKRHLVERTERDRTAQEEFGNLKDTDGEAIHNYLSKLFEYGMYLRRWKGPGTAYPMREADTLCTTFNMDRDLLAPTGRLQEARSALSSEARRLIDSLSMKHYRFGKYSESESMTISDLIYQLNRQDDDNMCIRMGSTKVIGSAVYYLKLLLDADPPESSGTFAIEALDLIQ